MLKLMLILLQAIVAACLLTNFPGCTPSRKEVVHPDFERFPPDSTIDYSVDISNRSEIPLPHFFHPDSLRHLATIGNDSTFADEYYDNTPQKLDIDSAGNIYIVQERTNSIHVYNRKGEFLYSIGRGGRGPGEFIEISRFVFDKTYKKLYVLDVFEIEIFVRKNGRFEYETSVTHHFMRAYDLCLLGKELFVSGYKMTREGRQAYKDGTKRRGEAKVAPPITKVDLETFEHTLSFGYEYKSYSGWGYYSGRLSETMLSCNEYSKTVVGYLKRFPYIFGYDTVGRQKWVSRMDGYMSTQSREVRTPEGPAFYPHTNEDIFNWKYPVQEIYNKEYSLLQFIYSPLVKYYASSDIHQIGRPIRTILVDTKSGELVYSDAYDYIGVWKDDVVITMDIDPETYQKTFEVHEYK